MSKQSSEIESWAESIRQRGLNDAMRMMLAVLEPVGPLGAQALWVVQPLAGLFGWRKAVGELAQILEQPGGIDALRRALREGAVSQDENPVTFTERKGRQ